jgi:predicted alpha/beta hydrolase
VEYRHVEPQRSAIGHVGFFLPHCEPLWVESLQWLRREVGAS